MNYRSRSRCAGPAAGKDIPGPTRSDAMKRFALVLCGLAVLTLACPTMAAKDDKKAADKAGKKKEGKGGKGALRGYYAIMSSVLELSDEQKAQLTEKIKARAAALKAWDEDEKGQKLAELLTKAKDADKDAAKEIRKEAAALRKERVELEASHKAKIMDVLTDEQKTKWEGHLLYTQMMRQFKKVGPTEEQEGKIRALCAAKAADAQAADDDAKALRTIRTDLAAAITKDILTDEQRTKLTAKKEKPAPKPKKDKKEK